jgi:trimethyllysine dioxygenase
MKDTAYTSLALPAHTDNTYFTDPSGLQMFHLLSHTDGTGGASLLVDGFHCAELLFKADPRAYKILSTYPVQWHASGNKGITITPARKFPVLNLNEDNESHKSLMQVRWNNDDRATMPHQEIRGIKIDEWYEAARLWNSILTDKKNEYWEQLVPGRPLSKFKPPTYSHTRQESPLQQFKADLSAQYSTTGESYTAAPYSQANEECAAATVSHH